jgi:hypothetical protein
MKRTLRILIILNWMTAIAAVVVSTATRKYLPSELTSYLEAKSRSGSSQFNRVVIWLEIILLAISLIDSVGLFLLRRWAKLLLLPLYALAMGLLPTNPVYIQTGWTRLLLSLSTLIGGIILGMIFFSPLAEVFDRTADTE